MNSKAASYQGETKGINDPFPCKKGKATNDWAVDISTKIASNLYAVWDPVDKTLEVDGDLQNRAYPPSADLFELWKLQRMRGIN